MLAPQPSTYFLPPALAPDEVAAAVAAFADKEAQPPARPRLCCLNHLGKLDHATFEAWLEVCVRRFSMSLVYQTLLSHLFARQILRLAPNTDLWLIKSPADAADAVAAAFAASGLAPARLVLTDKLPRGTRACGRGVAVWLLMTDERLASLGQRVIWPRCRATATSSWTRTCTTATPSSPKCFPSVSPWLVFALVCPAGPRLSRVVTGNVGQVTHAGATQASRVAASLLHAAGLPQLATTSWAAYVATAVQWAADAPARAAARRHLLARRGALVAPAAFARAFATALTTAHARARLGQPPAAFAVPGDEHDADFAAASVAGVGRYGLG